MKYPPRRKTMRRQTSVLLASTIVVGALMVIGAATTAGSLTNPPEPPYLPERLSSASAGPQSQPTPGAAPDKLFETEKRARRAAADAGKRGADISFTMLDRKTGRLLSTGNGAPIPIASVAKLFIADDLLMRKTQEKSSLRPRDRQALASMLRSSDDFPADEFWSTGGGNAIIKRVADRYRLAGTTPPYNGDWWNTTSTTADLVRYYDMLLDGTGGLPQDQVAIIMSDLAASTPLGADGYPQRFGIPDGLAGEPVAVKQGWMCCWGVGDQVHLSTGVVGKDRRYVIAVASMQPVDEAAARNTVTQTLKAVFPGGQI
jgi:hypothetical protein